MAVTVSVYGQTLKHLLAKEIVYTTLHAELLSNTASFTVTHTNKTQVDNGAQATVTMTIASPGVVTDTAHGFSNGQAVTIQTTGALPTGLTAGTWYYLVNKTTDTYQLSATVGGTAINTSVSQSGVHTRTSSGSYEIYGNAWIPGGPLLTTVAFTAVAINDGTVNDAKMTADNVDVVASGGTIGPAYNALVYDETGMIPLFFISFGQAQSAGDTTDFKIVWNAAGIFTFTI